MDAVITLLIGHRGTGKTAFLQGLRGVVTRDLDFEIEKATGQTIEQILERGENVFRELERTTLARLMREAKEPTVIALGAGFEGPMPTGARIVWLGRSTDSAGRSFLNRPRLDARLSPFAEYRERFFERERRFAEWAHEEFFLPEGYRGGLEKIFLGEKAIPYDVTLLPENFRDWKTFISRRTARRWEIRDDLLNETQIQIALRDLPPEKILFSRRASNGKAPESVTIDWPLELGAPHAEAWSISLHERENDFAETLAKLSAYSGQLKLAVEVKDFSELKAGHEWFLKDPAHRSFLPRSQKGRWRWYRSLFGPRMPLHFVREGMGSSLDQPLLWQCYLQPTFNETFGAVLGHPVEHSRSPSEHADLEIPFVAIDIPEEDFAVALSFLAQIGLRYAAVTAPLKKLAWAQAQSLSSEARQAQAVNSLYLNDGKIVAHNTDILALQEIGKDLNAYKSVWLWGGGGVKASIKKIWPQAREISAREGSAESQSPDLLIWAVGRQRNFVWPSSQVRPRLILDLNYSDDSPGLELAVRENLPYQSGLRMFKLQAEFQRRFWRACATGESP